VGVIEYISVSVPNKSLKMRYDDRPPLGIVSSIVPASYLNYTKNLASVPLQLVNEKSGLVVYETLRNYCKCCSSISGILKQDQLIF
jgi:hypothetical protein